MNPAIQDTLLQLFEHVQHDPDSLLAVPINEWQEGSTERQLLTSFSIMIEQVQQRILQLGQAEQQLREKEEQYRSIFEAVTDSLTIARQEDGQIVEVNPAACKMLGYSYEELIGKLPADLVPPDFLPLVAEGLQEIQVGERNDPPPMVALRKDGSSILVEAHSTQFTYKEKPHYLTVSHDITERVQAEEQLREREEQYRNVFEATFDALFIMDLDGFLLEVNPAFCRMFGYSCEEIIGLHASVLAAPVSLPGLADALRTLNTGRGTQTVVGQGLRKDGTAFYVESQSTTFTFRGKPHALGVVREITERVEAEQQLREREEQYRSIFEATNDAVFIMNPEDGHIVEANPAACNMYGYSYEDFIGLPPSAVIHPDQLPTFREEALPLTRTGGKRQIQGVNSAERWKRVSYRFKSIRLYLSGKATYSVGDKGYH